MELQNFLGAGIQRISLTEDALCNAILSCKANSPEVTVITIRGRKMSTLNCAFDELAAALQLPYYFGNNWAALDECINDRDWMPQDKCILVVTHAKNLFFEEPAPERELEVFQSLLTRAIHDWASGANGRKLELSCVMTL